MPEPITAAPAPQGASNIASTPQPEVVDQSTTQPTSNESPDPLQGMMDALDLPPEIQKRISKHQVAPQPSQPAPETPAVEDPTVQPESPEAQQPPVVTDETDETDDEDETGEIAEEPPVQGQQPPKIDKRQKRINRLTRKNSELESKLDAAVNELSTLRKQSERVESGKDVPIPSASPLSYIGDEQTLDAELSKANGIVKWCNENPDGLSMTDESGREIFHSPKDVERWRNDANVVVNNAANRRLELQRWNYERNHFDGMAREICPKLFDKTSEEYQEATAMLQQFPGIKASPRVNYALAIAVEGAKSVQTRFKQKLNGNGNSAPPAKRGDINPIVFNTPRVPIAPHTAEPPSVQSKPSSKQKFNDAMSDLVKDQDNNLNHLARAFAAIEESNRTRPTPKSPVKV